MLPVTVIFAAVSIRIRFELNVNNILIKHRKGIVNAHYQNRHSARIVVDLQRRPARKIKFIVPQLFNGSRDIK